ncbi:Eco57I restriction-modification methylase domain-containing protein [Salisaeta longa]|uniref:Eco57I restriction-modification methylase domain-containing protein n=1 Tax=Salisaeta longa TaxID=503170 RepID=UPI0003F525B8|nr:Eco57I restriction-modification methylase domain-containing protein [Salisaeta longa]
MAQARLGLKRPRIVQQAVNDLATASNEDRGAILTRPEVVRFILDLAGYTTDQNLCSFRLLDPSCGHGAFVCEAVSRLLTSGQPAVEQIEGAIRAVELNDASYRRTRKRLHDLLSNADIDPAGIDHLLDAWVTQDDFLLADIEGPFTHVVGNPPYIRHEQIPDVLTAAYKQRYDCIQGRADLYVPFIERGLDLLSADGQLAYICPDRWVKNAYGKGLRRRIDRAFHVSAFVDMTGTAAFAQKATAYPSIFLIERARSSSASTSIVRRPAIDDLTALVAPLRQQKKNARVHVLPRVTDDDQPWLLDRPEEVAILRGIEERFPTIEDIGCKVGIGVATGADDIFVRQSLPVEGSRQLPVVKTADIQEGKLDWGGYHVLNLFNTDGSLVDLSEYPKLAVYLKKHEERIRNRYIARKYPDQWYRTIDKIHTALLKRPKLLIPDIKGEAAVAYDPGSLYPHHNVYYVVSDDWDLQALQAVLRSTIAEFFIAIYSVWMRGNYLRFQAQYLRRIRVPRWDDVSRTMRDRLREAARQDQSACDTVTFDLFGLSDREAAVIRAAVGDVKS